MLIISQNCFSEPQKMSYIVIPARNGRDIVPWTMEDTSPNSPVAVVPRICLIVLSGQPPPELFSKIANLHDRLA
jgi:hypothetical protein